VGAAVHPRRFGVWRDAFLLCVGVAAPTLWLILHDVVRSWFALNSSMPTDPWVSALGASVSQIAIAALGGVAALVLFRGRLIALVIIATGILGAWITVEYEWSNAGGCLLLSRTGAWMTFAWVSWLFNPAILGAALWWGISARRAWKPVWACQSCGYDLRAAGSAICPECGTPRHSSTRASIRTTQAVH
jgi:hypothetical protein